MNNATLKNIVNKFSHNQRQAKRSGPLISAQRLYQNQIRQALHLKPLSPRLELFGKRFIVS